MLKDPYQPTWGRSDAHYILAAFYKREGRNEEAMLILQKRFKTFSTEDYHAESATSGTQSIIPSQNHITMKKIIIHILYPIRWNRVQIFCTNQRFLDL